MVVIEPLGTQVLLPAFVVGFELPEGDARDRVRRWAESPDWIVTLDQQAGGRCMRYPTVVGAVLRFTDNVVRFSRNAEFLIRGFQAMAEDPQLDVLERDYPTLHAMVNTWGDDYNPQQLQRLGAFLARGLAVPEVESGFEAFIRFAPCDPLDYLADWRLLRVEVLAGLRDIYRDQVCPTVEESNLDKLRLRGDLVLDVQCVGELQALGSRVGQAHPRLFLLWENSD